jgi:hypothetical protein
MLEHTSRDHHTPAGRAPIQHEASVDGPAHLVLVKSAPHAGRSSLRVGEDRAQAVPPLRHCSPHTV